MDGASQISRRGLRNFNAGAGRYPAEVFNINNAARNLVEIIANAARADTGDYRIRIYTLGMGELVTYLSGDKAGALGEHSQANLQRQDIPGIQQRSA